MQNQLQRVINLAKKTGAQVIVFDAENNVNSYVVMSLEDYENLINSEQRGIRGLTEEELLDKINCDIASWKNENEPGASASISPLAAAAEKGIKKLENLYAGAGEEKNGHQNQRSNWSIPASRKKLAEEIIEEDRQYLEEVRF